ncbi:MAG TPA: two-component regulator propeller domain-containing protein, partial [Flavisolibacter sp.]|nr:two-component regulator propeller domain-containing protein [Flavisolibacter sp.]
MRFIPFILTLFSLCAVAQPYPSPQVTLYYESNGGPSGLVNCVLQAKDGFLWLGASNGLWRFDGYSFKRYANTTGPSDNVTCLTEDGNGNLWMGYPEGKLGKLNPL